MKSWLDCFEKLEKAINRGDEIDVSFTLLDLKRAIEEREAELQKDRDSWIDRYNDQEKEMVDLDNQIIGLEIELSEVK